MSKLDDTDVSLTSLNVSTSEEDSWAYVSENVSDQSADFEEWLDKNGVSYIITNDYLEDSIASPREDDTLTQVDDYETYQQTANEETTSEPEGNKLNQCTKVCSKYSLLEVNSKANMFIELVQDDNVLKVKIRNSQGDEIVPFHCLSPSEVGGQIKHPFIRQAVATICQIELAPELDLCMPKLQTEQGLKLFLCPQQDCREAFMRLAIAKLHGLVHLEHKPYKCSYANCTWAFYTPFKLRRHEDTHFKRKDFICPFPDCARRFTTIYNLNGHKRRHERPADLPCPVDGCNEMFQTIRARQIHLRGHHPSEASFECPEPACSKKFFTQASLQSHARSHTHRGSDLQCQWPNCGKVFEIPYRLKEHERMHTGQKPYCCTFENCKWSFSTASKLKRHQSTHTNDRKFHCTIGTCSKSFLRSEHLKEHTLTHIGQRTFVCDGN